MNRNLLQLACAVAASVCMSICSGGETTRRIPFYAFDQFHEEWHLWQPNIAALTVDGAQGNLRVTFNAAGTIGLSERDRMQKKASRAIRAVFECTLVSGEAMIRLYPEKWEPAAAEVLWRKLQPGENRITLDFPAELPENTTFATVELKSDQPGTVVELKSGELVLACGQLEGVAVDVETGSAFHIVRPGEVAEKLRLKLVNQSPQAIQAVAKGTLNSFNGYVLPFSIPVSLEAGESKLVPLADQLPEQGAWRVNYTLSAPGETPVSGLIRFAVFDPVGVTDGRAKGFLFGACSHVQTTPRSEFDLEFHSAALIGIKIVRLDTAWCAVEAAKGQFDFSGYDEWINILDQYQMEAQCLLGLAPGWAEDPDWRPAQPEKGRNGNVLPRDSDWGDFLKGFAEHYRDRVRFYELYNEPDLYGFGNFTVDDFIRSYNAGADAIHAAVPDAKVMSGGFATINQTCDTKRDFYPRAVTETLNHFDVLAIHEHGDFESFRGKIDNQWRPLLQNNHAVSKPVYCSETSIDGTGGEDVQAAALVQKLLFAWSRGAVAYNWYKIRNNEFVPTPMSDFGLLTRDFYPKAVYAAYNELIRLYSDAAFVRELPDEHLQLFLFRNNDKQLLAGWNRTARQNGAILLKTDARKVVKIDLMGNRTEIPIHNHTVLFAPGRYPATLELTGGTDAAIATIPGNLVSGAISAIVTPGSSVHAELQLQNPGTMPMTFQLQTMTAPGLAVKRISPVKVAPGQTGRVPLSVRVAPDFELARNGFGGQDVFRVFYYIAETGWSGELSLPLQSIAIVAPVGDFSVEPQFVMDRQEQQMALVGYNPEEDHMRWRGKLDLSAKMWLALSRESLQVKLIVTDDIHVQKSGGDTMYDGDSLELILEEPDQKGGWVFGATMHDDGQSEFHCWYTANGSDSAAAGKTVTGKVSRVGTTTTYLFQIPLKTLAWTPALLRRGIRIQAHLNDNDGAKREGWLQLSPTAEPEKPSVVFLSKNR